MARPQITPLHAFVLDGAQRLDVGQVTQAAGGNHGDAQRLKLLKKASVLGRELVLIILQNI